MIEQQIRPWNVLDQDVLALLGTVKREDYFPDDQKSMAFFDTELALPGGAHTLSPKVEARIVQGVGCGNDEAVLAAVRSLPQFRPGRQNGQPVAVKFVLPFTFHFQ